MCENKGLEYFTFQMKMLMLLLSYFLLSYKLIATVSLVIYFSIIPFTVEAQLRSHGRAIGIVVGVMLSITLISSVVLVLCMLVPQCPLGKVYSTKPGAGVDTDGGRGTRVGPREGSGERELERSGAPLITDNQHNTS